MKLLVIVLACIVAVAVARRHRPVRHQSIADAWQAYKVRYNKTYTAAEEPRRQQLWHANARFVKKHNEKPTIHNVELNEIADLTPAEYSRLNGFRQSYGDDLSKRHAAKYLAPLNFVAPRSVDWRDHGYVTPVKNQGMCGSCWAFSTTGSLEGQHKRANGQLVSLSEQNLVDCSTSYGNHGCNGGLMDNAFQYIKDNQGIDTENGYPYEGKESRCRYKEETLGATDAGFVDVTEGDEHALMNAVAANGPVSIAIDASHKSFQMYKKGVYIEPECSPQALDHGVLVVGYGTSEDEGDYWIVKNSWGPNWGENGYIRMARNRQNQCGVASKASYPLV